MNKQQKFRQDILTDIQSSKQTVIQPVTNSQTDLPKTPPERAGNREGRDVLVLVPGPVVRGKGPGQGHLF